MALIDSLVAYTNAVFQVMLSDASRVSAALHLPLPQPIPPALVSKLAVNSTSPEVNGSVTVSNRYYFAYRDGFLRSVSAEWDKIGQPRFLGAPREGPPPEFPDAAPFLRYSEESIVRIGINTNAIALARHRFLTHPTVLGRFFAEWRLKGREDSLVRIDLFPDRSVAELQVHPDEALGQFYSHSPLTVDSVPNPATPIALFSQSKTVDCGPDDPTPTEAGFAASTCWESLREKIGDQPLQMLIAEDNLNRPEAIHPGLRRVASNVVYISIAWSNPPPPFPEERIRRAAEKRRGINMVAITGDVRVTAMHAAFPRESGRKIHVGQFPSGPGPKTRAVADLVVKQLPPAGPPVANAYFHLPNAPAHAQMAMFGAVREKGIAINGKINTLPARFVSAIGDFARTNDPVVLLISGGLPIEGHFRNPRPNAEFFRPLATVINFHENRLEYTFESLGETGVSILNKAKEVETFTLRAPSLGPNDTVKGGLFDGYYILKRGPRLRSDDANALADILLSEGGPIVTSAHYFDRTFVGFRLAAPEGSILIFVCFNEAGISWTVKNPKGSPLATGLLSATREQSEIIRRLARKAFPNLEELRERD